MSIVYLLLGSNLGDRHLYLQQAIQRVAADVGRVVQGSALYETQAWGNTETPDYLNQIIKVETILQPEQVLDAVLNIEHELGRVREEKWGARTLDIDLLFYDDIIINTPRLTVPHPYLHLRRFTLEPLAELSPALVHPVLKKAVSVLKDELNDNLIVKKL